MPANTNLADINEIYFGYYLAGETWFDPEAKKQVEAKRKLISLDDFNAQVERAKVMAVEAVKWARLNGYSGKVKQVWWTARPGSLSEAVGQSVDQRKNPTDILVQFTSGPANGFLGLSAKSTKGTTDIGFKNPGLGTVEANLKVDLKKHVDKATKEAIKKFGLSESSSQRKEQIRKNPMIQKYTQEKGAKSLAQIRDDMMNKMRTMSQPALRKHIMTDWMDASDAVYPPYVKVTGFGNKGPYTARVEDPMKSEKLAAINKGTIRLEKVGNEGIGIYAGNKKVLKMRAKFESEKLASSVKFSGEPF